MAGTKKPDFSGSWLCPFWATCFMLLTFAADQNCAPIQEIFPELSKVEPRPACRPWNFRKYFRKCARWSRLQRRLRSGCRAGISARKSPEIFPDLLNRATPETSLQRYGKYFQMLTFAADRAIGVPRASVGCRSCLDGCGCRVSGKQPHYPRPMAGSLGRAF